MRELGVRGLQAAGYRVLEAADAEEAIALAGTFAGRIDLLVTDLVLPKMGGLELAARIRELRPGVKTLFVSGYPIGEEVGPVTLEKPYTLADFAKKVREALEWK